MALEEEVVEPAFYIVVRALTREKKTWVSLLLKPEKVNTQFSPARNVS